MRDDPVAPGDVRYIKLGPGGAWFDHARENNLLELGHQVVSHDLSRARDKAAIRTAFVENGSDKAATDFAREVWEFVHLPKGSLWITFARGLMWWCEAGEKVFELGVSPDHGFRARELSRPWRCTDLAGVPLRIEGLSGRLTKVAAYRRSVCRVEAADYAVRLINALPSLHVAPAANAMAAMIAVTRSMLADLDPADFETLVDLVFLRGGWRRVSRLGGIQADTDLVLVEPISGERAFVQVKSEADATTLADYVARYHASVGFSRMFFVVHSPQIALPSPADPSIAVWQGDVVAERAVEAGLFSWLLEHSR